MQALHIHAGPDALAHIHQLTPLDSVVLLVRNPEWVQTLPNGKLPNRKDFMTYGQDLQARVKVWSAAASAAQQLVEEFAQWLERPDAGSVKAL